MWTRPSVAPKRELSWWSLSTGSPAGHSLNWDGSMYSQAIASAQLEKSCFCYNKLKLSNWRRVVSFTLKALELEMQSGFWVQQAEIFGLHKSCAFTLEALELEMQPGIRVQHAEAFKLEKSCFFYTEGSRTRDTISYYSTTSWGSWTGEELFCLHWRLSN